MPRLALALLALYGVTGLGVRALVQLRRTGSTGLKGIPGEAGSTAWLAGLLLVTAVALVAAGPVLDLAGVLEPLRPLDASVVQAVGLVMALAGIGATVLAQFAMGDSWRVGVDDAERTELVTDGPFSVVRHPIFATMILAFFGLALLVPNWISLAGALSVLLALELQVRLVEEPHLLRAHGRAYGEYASRVGRFVPGVGRREPPRPAR